MARLGLVAAVLVAIAAALLLRERGGGLDWSRLDPVALVSGALTAAVLVVYVFFNERSRRSENAPGPYELLGVPAEASDKEIRSAYVNRLHELRAALSPSHPNHERLTALEDAYRILSDPQKRAQYDGSRAPEGGASDSGDLAAYIGKEVNDSSIHPVAGCMLLLAGTAAMLFGVAIFGTNNLWMMTFGGGVLYLGLFAFALGLERLTGRPFARGLPLVFPFVMALLPKDKKSDPSGQSTGGAGALAILVALAALVLVVLLFRDLHIRAKPVPRDRLETFSGTIHFEQRRARDSSPFWVFVMMDASGQRQEFRCRFPEHDVVGCVGKEGLRSVGGKKGEALYSPSRYWLLGQTAELYELRVGAQTIIPYEKSVVDASAPDLETVLELVIAALAAFLCTEVAKRFRTRRS